MAIIGIDYSYTSPAITVLGDDFKSSTVYYMNQKKKVVAQAQNYKGTLMLKDWAAPVDRFESIAKWAVESIRPHWTDGSVIYLEGYAYGAGAGRAFDIAENGGMLKYHLKLAFGAYPVILPPTTVKKHWCGRGNGKKEDMVQALEDKEGVNIVKWLCMDKLDSPAHDIVDSYAIAVTGRDTHGNSK